MQLGYITPPVGMNLFIASYRFERPMIEVYRATVPFFVILLGTVLVITYWPALSLTLVGNGG
jgi:TRAP-type C4-dicarboxylate transport system permease large subunit